MWYDENTLEIQALNVDLSYIPEGSKLCKIKEADLIDFHTDKKQHHLFLVVVDENGFAKFKHRYLYNINQRFDERRVIENNIIQDLDYRKIFFDYINIKYSCVDDITLTFDIDNLETNYRETYVDTITEDKSDCQIFITEYQNPTALLTSVNLNLYQLIKTKIVNIPLSFNQPISLWGIKT
jgi:hypothetical protein